VENDSNTHGGGQLNASVNDGTVFVNGIKVVLKGSTAKTDAKFPPNNRPHDNPFATGSSPNVYACGGGSASSHSGSPDEAAPDPSRADLYGPTGGGNVPDPNVQRNADGSPVGGDVNQDGEVDSADRFVDTGVSPGYPADMGNAEIESIIREEALLRGINPETAIAVYHTEGAGAYQSQIPANNNRAHNGKEASFGPYQLYTGAGLGREYENSTGRNLITDNNREGITNQVRYALDNAARNRTWAPWYGWTGPKQQGLAGSRPVANWN
jgi:hypothetical protein